MTLTHLNIAQLTAEAHMHDTYGREEWLKVIAGLAQRNFEVMEIIAVLRSSWMRHCTDDYTAKSFLKYFDRDMKKPHFQRELASLLRNTFPEV